METAYYAVRFGTIGGERMSGPVRGRGMRYIRLVGSPECVAKASPVLLESGRVEVSGVLGETLVSAVEVYASDVPLLWTATGDEAE